MAIYRLPLAFSGQVIGLLGGSFDPPHPGHVHISREALKRFGLDQVWWLVSPGNPLKAQGPAPMDARIAAARKLVTHPRIHISDFEAQADTRYTARTLQLLQEARPDLRFVWLMGADNLAQFHRWQDWQGIMHRVPMAILARPGIRTMARSSKAAKVYAGARLPGRRSILLATHPTPVWCFVNVPMMDISSTLLRGRGDWTARSMPNAKVMPDASKT